jgi:hypothetical protein
MSRERVTAYIKLADRFVFKDTGEFVKMPSLAPVA